MILSEDQAKRRVPPRSLAILIFRKTGWKHECIAGLTEDQMAVFEACEPWEPKRKQAA